MRLPLGLFLLQLFFNALWSWLFFGRHQPALAFGDILLLWLSLLATMVAFWKVNVVAGRLLVPYLLCMSFAEFNSSNDDSRSCTGHQFGGSVELISFIPLPASPARARCGGRESVPLIFASGETAADG